jgi:hypothetical protein
MKLKSDIPMAMGTLIKIVFYVNAFVLLIGVWYQLSYIALMGVIGFNVILAGMYLIFKQYEREALAFMERQ